MPVRRFLCILLTAAILRFLVLVNVLPADERSDFTVVVLPDTQFYAESHPDTYIAQTQWIKDRAKADNIKFVIHLGDIVQNYNNSEEEWEVADRAHRILDGVVPYSVVPGNHDMQYEDKKLYRDTRLYNKYFSPARFDDYPWYGGHMGETNDSNYCFFEAAEMKFMVLSLEYAAPDETLEWADRVVSSHPECRVIVATHCYMRPQGRDTACGTAYGLADNSGEDIWQKFVRKHTNIFAVISGHVLGVGTQTSTNDAGRPVHEMLVDYQGLPNGGDGWLRTLRFAPAENKIYVAAYSPLLDETNKTPAETFSLDYQMTPIVEKEKQHVLDWLSQAEVVETFGGISDAIWSYAELGLQEHKSSALLIKTLEEAGFSVEKGLAGMPTCFVASYGSGQPVIGILAEYDALPMLSQAGRASKQQPIVAGAPGHGCGHNLMGTAATAAAIAVKRSMEEYNLGGTIRLFGSPAEEMLVSRPYMVRAKLFEGVDAVINNHASSTFQTGHGISGSAMYSVIYTFEGRTAHSGAAPWNGRSALDAVELMNVATNYLREHLHFTHRMHYIIPEGGEAPNVVPDRASVWYFLRNTDGRLQDMYERVHNCAKGAALATGTELAQVRVMAAIHQSHHNKALAEVLMKNIELVGMPDWTDEEHAFARSLQEEMGGQGKGMPTEVGKLKPPAAVFTGGASSDHGDVTLIAPTATVRFPGIATGVRGHHWSTVTCGHGSTAWKGLNAGAKAMAATTIDLLTETETLETIRGEFEEYAKTHPYKSFLPKDAQPPLEINEKLMKQYRPLMEAFYQE